MAVVLTYAKDHHPAPYFTNRTGLRLTLPLAGN
jgi:hypothetical protein